MAVVTFQREGSVGQVVLSNPPKNLIGSSFAIDLRAAIQEERKTDCPRLARPRRRSELGRRRRCLRLSQDGILKFVADVHR